MTDSVVATLHVLRRDVATHYATATSQQIESLRQQQARERQRRLQAAAAPRRTQSKNFTTRPVRVLSRYAVPRLDSPAAEASQIQPSQLSGNSRVNVFGNSHPQHVRGHCQDNHLSA